MDDSTASARRRLHRRPSLTDVAALAGVAPITVSRVANEHENVDPVTRERVLEAMRKIGYQPNRMARALRSGRYRNVGVIVFGLGTIGNVRTLEAIAAACAAADYSLTLVAIETADQEHVSAAFTRMRREDVDGVVIVLDQNLMDHSIAQLPSGLPVVVVDSNERPDYPVIDTDQRQGARLATQHLIDLGHRTVWHVTGPSSSFAAVHREDAWREALVAAGRRVPEPIRGDWTPRSGYAAGVLLRENLQATAVFAANDQMALGIIGAFHEVGIKVPAEVSVVGFDDVDEAVSLWPPLTTIHQRFDLVGSTAFDTLLAKIDDHEFRSKTVRIQTSLVVRSSTAAPARKV
ncbi:LacI family transcriptional regulator [Rathayibacter caricis DSM 15933]|uniref:LacI family transcriptional regulator n=1 Tax=Rathayibacter caricis DSM 15933 TaxID=1328867 RepID=A0A2T4UPC3_9MICO|nr:LacI family DNA-binding transcriptional regulator [Rathayibacter caricis]PTL71380.1 LacI family transcriptional regulator [Rathayibacter caricis DSM 15933]